MANQPKRYKKFVATAATATLVASAIAPVASASFKDVADNNDHKKNIEAIAELGYMGAGDNFRPSENVTRGQVAIILANWAQDVAGLEVPADYKDVQRFKDVPLTADDKLLQSAALVKEYGIFEGSNGNLNGASPISREHMALVLNKAYEAVTGTSLVELAGDTSDVTFADEASINKDYLHVVKALKKLGITAPASFNPKGSVTRGQFASFFVQTVNAEEPVDETELKVESVSAINAKQIQVTFTTAMDKDSVTDVTKYAIKKAGAAAASFTATGTPATNAKAELSTDGKTVTITLETPLTTTGGGNWAIAEGDVFNVEYKALKAADGKEIEAGSATVKYSDKVAPEFVSATASAKTSTNKITVTFNEPIDFGQATATIDGKSATIGAGSKPNEVVLTSGTNLEVGKTYNVSLLNIKDVAGNLIGTNPLTTTVTVASDTVAPIVADIKVVRDSLLEVTFDKSMDASTISSTSIKVLDVNLNNTGIIQGTVTAKPDTDNKTFLIPVSALPFNNGTFSGVVSVANTVKDVAGNASAAVTKNVTITKDETAPQVVSATYKNVTSYNGIATANGAIVVKFNEEVNASAAAASYVVVDDKGASVATPISARAVNPKDNTELVLTLNAGVANDVKAYTVVLPNSAVTDKAIAANPSKSANLTVDVSAGAPVASDTTAPVVNTVTETAATSSTSGTTIVVAYTETGSGLDTVSAASVNNYRLDGVALPAGSYITVAGTTATINIPAGSFAKDKAYALNINGVKDKAGNTMSPYVGSVTLKDDIVPEFTATTLNSNGTVSLSFSESVNAAVAGTVNDFAVTLNGSLLTGTNKAYTIANGVGADAGKYVLSVKVGTIGKAATGGSYTDPNGGTWTTANAADVIEFKFIDVDGDQDLTAGDIILSGTDTGATTAITFTDTEIYDVNKATSFKVATIASPTVVKDTSNLTNGLKGSKSITVK